MLKRKSNSTYERGYSACPSAASGNKVFPNQQSTPLTYLQNAFEIMGDFVGNDNGLCESNEACVYAPNWGAYQGHGDYYSQASCTFTNGTVTGVSLYAYPSNGR